jgi:hypothetical protein
MNKPKGKSKPGGFSHVLLSERACIKLEKLLAHTNEPASDFIERLLFTACARRSAVGSRQIDEDLDRFLSECCAISKKAFVYTHELLKINAVWAEGTNACLATAKDLAGKLREPPFNCVQRTQDGGIGWVGIYLTVKIKTVNP